jgi:hypothetical protein
MAFDECPRFRVRLQLRFRTYLKGLTTDWLSRMCGLLSVPKSSRLFFVVHQGMVATLGLYASRAVSNSSILGTPCASQSYTKTRACCAGRSLKFAGQLCLGLPLFLLTARRLVVAGRCGHLRKHFIADNISLICFHLR